MSRYIIVGGVAGGASAAARLRRLDETAEIIVIERGPYVSFANCGLPYHIGGVIKEREALLVSTPEKLKGEFAIDVRTEQEVVRIDRAAKEVEVRPVKGGTPYRLAYDKLILSPGAKPIVPPIPGIDAPGIYTLRDIPSMDAIKERVDQGNVRDAVVVGGGFIGLEMAENLMARGLTVTVVEMLNQVMSSFDFELAAILHRHLREKGVRLALGDGLRAVKHLENGQLELTLASGRSTVTDMIVLAIGVRPESDLARAAGLELGPRGHILVNEHMQTSDPDIYAVGDAVQVFNPVTGAWGAVPLAGPASRQARIAADHIVGRRHPYPGALATSIVKIFDLAAACTGANSQTLQQQGIPFLSSITHSDDHAGYYPGAKPQTIKLLYTPGEGKLLGAQVVGYNAVDRTIGVLATALKAGMTVFDLENLDLPYAPPYGAAKDPVNIAGYVAANRLRGDTELVEWRDVLQRDPDTTGILDVRTDAEWQAGHIPGAVHIPNVELRRRLGELDKSKEWFLYCAIGRRGYVMERMLKQQGFKVKNISGGWRTYQVATEQQDNFDTCQPPQRGDSLAKSAESESVAPDAARTAAPTTAITYAPTARLDALGLQCPGPIMAVYKRIQELRPGEVLEVLASDPGFRRDVAAWCENTGNDLLELGGEDGTIKALIRKGAAKPQVIAGPQGATTNAKTMVVFSGDLDHALASFVIANGAAAMGQKVTMFFTFWGLNILRRRDPKPVKKNLVEKMFGWMLPKGADALKLSRLNMGGMGTWMMKKVMQAKGIDPLPQLIRSALANGVRLVACQMTMDMMGIKPEELMDGVEIGGVASFINAMDKANASLFI
jgi:NADPH-dependent 2,4-dienoyl-CoA reductase/sulfur reductase-like enzyme/peroxiredoxin family protein/TusA-related sulfurtransferase/rhodanese-related sulfurtransferase